MIYEVLMNMLALHFDNNEVSFTPYQQLRYRRMQFCTNFALRT